jgi:radical S-adenosyl methionine domain-containing protein 2
MKRYPPLSEEDFKLVVETNDLMKDSYVMINPQSQFYNITTGRHVYSSPICYQ